MPFTSLQLVFLVSAVSSAFPVSSSSIPRSLQSRVPLCAQSCVQTFLNSEYPVGCTATGDLGCLCSQYSQDGFTLGEGIYRCTLSNCESAAAPDAASFYGVCLAQDDAVLPTHATLTVTESSSPTSTPPSNQASIQAASTKSSITRPSTSKPSTSRPAETTRRSKAPSSSGKGTSRPTQPSQSTSPSSSRTSPTPTHTFQSSSKATQSSSSDPLDGAEPKNTHPESTAAAVSSGEPTLNTQQIIGISVAGAAVVVLAIGIIALISFRRRRMKKQGYVDEFDEFDQPEKSAHVDSLIIATASPQPPFPPPKDNLKDPRGGVGGVGVLPHKRPPMPPLQTQPSWEKKGLRIEDIGVAISPDMETETSPASMSSTRTLSRLLPDKPRNAHVEPLRLGRPDSTMTIFEEEKRGINFTPVTSPTVAQPPLTLNIPVPPIKPEMVWYAKQASQNPYRPYRPASSLYSRAPSSYMAPPSRPVTEIENDDYIPPYYTRTRDGHDNRKSYGRNKSRPQASNRDSCASMTSFESGGDDPTPPEEEDKQLSPVPESPISGLRYPKVPRSANQAVPRSPPSPKFVSNYAPTLASKRRGDSAAHELERGLWITGSNSSSIRSGKESHSRGPSGSSGVGGPPQHPAGPYDVGGLQSPWEPKITPSRRGHDLFLSVT